MQKYVGVKLVEAEPMLKNGIPGYKVVYPDGYVSWSPKGIFESSYMEVVSNPQLKTDVSISQEMVNGFMKEIYTSTVGEKTTLVRCVLVNGFEIIEASACVDPNNYSEEIGARICIDKINDKIWDYLGFLLQTAVGGVR